MSIQGLVEMDDFVGTMLNAMPLPVFVVDDDVQIIAFNQTASQMLAKDPAMILRRRAGEILHCVHSTEVAEGCGRAVSCKDCIVRNSVTISLRDHKMVRQKARMELVEEGGSSKEIFLLVTTAPFQYNDNEFVLLILQDISELMELKRILPMCAHCKKIRNDDQYWHSVEQYFKEHMDVDFSHGLCPECLKKFYPDFCGETK
jgi:nitrogen-specific signal transduction histidine kinase